MNIAKNQNLTYLNNDMHSIAKKYYARLNGSKLSLEGRLNGRQ